MTDLEKGSVGIWNYVASVTYHSLTYQYSEAVLEDSEDSRSFRVTSGEHSDDSGASSDRARSDNSDNADDSDYIDASDDRDSSDNSDDRRISDASDDRHSASDSDSSDDRESSFGRSSSNSSDHQDKSDSSNDRSRSNSSDDKGSTESSDGRDSSHSSDSSDGSDDSSTYRMGYATTRYRDWSVNTVEHVGHSQPETLQMDEHITEDGALTPFARFAIVAMWPILLCLCIVLYRAYIKNRRARCKKNNAPVISVEFQEFAEEGQRTAPVIVMGNLEGIDTSSHHVTSIGNGNLI